MDQPALIFITAGGRRRLSVRAPEPDIAPAAGAGTIEPFLAHLAHERRPAPLTLLAYRQDLERIAGWLSQAGGEGTSIERMDQLLARRYVAWCHRAGGLGSDPPAGAREPA